MTDRWPVRSPSPVSAVSSHICYRLLPLHADPRPSRNAVISDGRKRVRPLCIYRRYFGRVRLQQSCVKDVSWRRGVLPHPVSSRDASSGAPHLYVGMSEPPEVGTGSVPVYILHEAVPLNGRKGSGTLDVPSLTLSNREPDHRPCNHVIRRRLVGCAP
jgi:hypothetical protein